MNVFGEYLKSHEKKENKSVVRIKTNIWNDSKGLHIRKDINILRRKSFGNQILEEDASNIGAKEVFKKIVNIEECEDGIYEVICCNEYHDFESGYVDDYDYKLIKTF